MNQKKKPFINFNKIFPLKIFPKKLIIIFILKINEPNEIGEESKDLIIQKV